MTTVTTTPIFEKLTEKNEVRVGQYSVTPGCNTREQVEGFLNGQRKLYTYHMNQATKGVRGALKIAKECAARINEYETRLGLTTTKFFFPK